jgi:hypothetical protein
LELLDEELEAMANNVKSGAVDRARRAGWACGEGTRRRVGAAVAAAKTG